MKKEQTREQKMKAIAKKIETALGTDNKFILITNTNEAVDIISNIHNIVDMVGTLETAKMDIFNKRRTV